MENPQTSAPQWTVSGRALVTSSLLAAILSLALGFGLGALWMSLHTLGREGPAIAQAVNQQWAADRQALKACQDRFATGTVLLEPQAPQIHVLNGMITIEPNVPGQPTVSRMAWYIPAHVEPRRLGDPGGYSYAYTDGQGRFTAGPFPLAAAGGSNP
jgi:hypothetical protein